MSTLHDPFKSEIATLAYEALNDLSKKFNMSLSISVLEIYQNLSTPPSFHLGQAALPCFHFAKTFKQPPQKIALNLSEDINKKNKLFVTHVQNEGAYLNFFCNFNNLSKSIYTEISNQHYFQKQLLSNYDKEKIVVEYSQPNTHKALHVGHLRCLVLGDAVSNVLQYVGHKVVRATFPGDLGNHVAKILWYITHPKPKPLPTENKTRWLGQMYAEADEAFKTAKGTPLEVEIKKDMSEILAQLSNASGMYYELWKTTREWSLDELKSIYRWLNSYFDSWYFESECEKPSIQLVQKKYEEGFFVKDNGAIGIDLSPWKLGFAMLLKSDGNGLYLTKDIDLIMRKFSDPEVTKSIYIVDSRQKLHFQQLFKIAELMGYPQAAKSAHLSYETVNTEDGKPFSSRQLNGLQLLDLKEKMEEKVKADYLQRYRSNWMDEDIQQTAENITIGALKYGMLRVDNTTQINFSLTEWLKLDGETGPYLQYVHARCSSIIAKIGSPANNIEFCLTEVYEQELLFLLSRFHDHVLLAAQQYRPSLIANYLYDLAKSFNRFYENCQIRNTEENTKQSRLALVQITQAIIQQGLKLLGIPAPQKM